MHKFGENNRFPPGLQLCFRIVWVILRIFQEFLVKTFFLAYWILIYSFYIKSNRILNNNGISNILSLRVIGNFKDLQVL